MLSASAAAVALTTTVLAILLDFGAAIAFFVGKPRPEMRDGIASARGASEERLGAHRGSGASRADVDRDGADDAAEEDGDEDDEARPPQEAARAAIVFFLLAA